VASIEETVQEGILAKLEPMRSLNWFEGSAATTVETGIVATWEDRAWNEDSY
jgi:hypothetical protein